jgi:hypothetical protein
MNSVSLGRNVRVHKYSPTNAILTSRMQDPERGQGVIELAAA